MLKKAEAKALLLDGAELAYTRHFTGYRPCARVTHSSTNERRSEFVRAATAATLIRELRMQTRSKASAVTRIYTVPKQQKEKKA